MKITRKIQIILTLLSSVLAYNSVNAVGGFNEWRFKHGWVMARGLVLDEATQKPIFASYDEAGEIVNGNIGVMVGELEKAYILSGDEYRATVKYYRDFNEANREGITRGATIMSGEAFKNASQTVGGFLTIDGKPVEQSSISMLLPSVKSVFVKSPNQIFIPKTDPALLQAKINLNAIDESIVSSTNIKSVLLNDLGNVVHSTQHNIGFKVKFFDGEEDRYRPGRNDKKYDPLDFVAVHGSEAFLGGSGVTDQDGHYSTLYMLPPCPGFTFEYTSPSFLKLYYKQFNPRSRSNLGMYHLMKTGYDFCSGLSASLANSTSLSGQMAYVNMVAIEATAPTILNQVDFYVDTAVIGGTGFFSNEKVAQSSGQEEALPLGPTKYQYEAPDHEFKPMADYLFDFDGDGQDDVAKYGQMEAHPEEPDELIFKQYPDGTELTNPLQGIYLSSGSQDPESNDLDKNQPDFVRIADRLPDLKDQGLLESISQDDFKDTDVLVFRESNGILITQRQGLREDEVDVRASSGFKEDIGEMSYSIMIRGPKSAPFDLVAKYGRGSNWFSAWQSAAQMDPSLHQRKADHIRPHEQIRIIAINRKTGYMGSVRSTYGKFITDGLISMKIDKIVMRPPNLKIIADREYDVQAGLTSGQGEDSERKYLIGYEGAALASDRIIKITTEWFDHDGSALPEELADFGYTGRLAKIVSQNVLGQDADVGGDLASFAIKPGRHTQLVQISDNPTKNEHYYVQVSPECKDECDPVSFETEATAEEPLKYRPKNYVPVLTPIADEALSLEQYRAYRKYKRDNPWVQVEKPTPVYKWYYRPELQFSLYSLEMKNIFRVGENENGDQTSLSIYQDDIPVLTNSDDLIKILYTLLEQLISPLEFLGAGQELVFALGEEEIKATFGTDQQLHFQNLEHLASLDAEDFLSFRLYSNNDPGNILWEYAFEYLTLYTPEDVEEQSSNNKIYVSADDPELDMRAVLLGYASRDEEQREPRTIKWHVDGPGQMSISQQLIDDDGFFNSKLIMSPIVGNQANVSAALESAPDSLAKFFTVEVIAGEPALITITTNGSASVQGNGTINAEIKAYDSNMNLVKTGTPVLAVIKGTANITSYQDTIVNGSSTATIKGGFYSGRDVELFVKVGDATFGTPISIETASVSLSGLPQILETNQVYRVNASVLAGGVSASNTYVELSGIGVRIEQLTTKTNVNGNLEFDVFTGSSPVSGKIIAKADFNQPTTLEFDVVNRIDDIRTGSLRQEALVIGDQPTSGTYQYTTLTGESTPISYVTETNMVLNGEPLNNWMLKFDDLHKINKQPILSYSGDYASSRIWVDQSIGNHAALTETSFVKIDVPRHTRSIQLKSTDSSTIQIPYKEELDTDKFQIYLSIKPEQLRGELVKIGNNTHRLYFDSANRLNWFISTSNGSQTIVSNPLIAGNWYDISFGFDENNLFLHVNSERLSEAVDGSAVSIDSSIVSSSGRENIIVSGDSYTGLIEKLYYYNLNAPSLLSFESNVNEIGGTFDGTGEAKIIISSNNNFNKYKSSLKLKEYETGFIMNDNTYTVNILNLNTWKQVREVYQDLAPNSNITPEAFTQQFSILNNMTAVKVGSQIMHLSVEGAQPETMTTSALGYIKLRPDMSAELIDHIRNLQEFYHSMQGQNILYAANESLVRAIREADYGNPKLLSNLSVSLVIMSEMINLDPEIAALLPQIIKGTQDFLVWSTYISLPKNGWIGDGYPTVSLDTDCSSIGWVLNQGTPFEVPDRLCRQSGESMASLIKELYYADDLIAQYPELLNSVVKDVLASLYDAPIYMRRLLSQTEPVTINQQAGIASKLLPEAHAILPVLTKGASQVLKSFVKVLVKKGKVGLKRFITGRHNARYRTPEILAAFLYLMTRDEEDCVGECSPLDSEVENRAMTEMIKGVASIGISSTGEISDDALERKRCTMIGWGHGSFNEVISLAYYHLRYELTGNEENKIIGVDEPVNVGLFEKKLRGRTSVYKPVFIAQRKPDIILHGGGPGQRDWVEVKSLSWPRSGGNRMELKEAIKKKFPYWDAKNAFKDFDGEEVDTLKSYNYQRQFILDRAASGGALVAEYWNNSVYFPANSTMPQLRARSMKWWLQIWNNEGDNGKRLLKKNKPPINDVYTTLSTPWMQLNTASLASLSNEFEKIQEKLVDLPIPVQGNVAKNSFGNTSNQTTFENRVVGTHKIIAPFSLQHAVADARNLFGIHLSIEQAIESRLTPELKKMLEDLKGISEADIDNYAKGIEQLIERAENAIPGNVDLPDWLTNWIDEKVNKYVEEAIGDLEMPDIEALSCQD